MEYKHELEFIGIGAPPMYEICEPIGFDGLKFEVDQEAKKFNRSVVFGALDKLEFVKAYGPKATTPQVRNQFGDLTEFLDYGLEWLLYGLEQKGFEFEVYYHLSKGGVYYPKMQLDFSDKDITDGTNYVQCKLIDVSLVMDYKRQSDTTFNAFSDKDFKGRTITPIQTFNYLRRATPIPKISVFELNNQILFTQSVNSSGLLAQQFANLGWSVTKGDILNTLAFFPNASVRQNNGSYSPPIENFNIINAKNDLTNVSLTIDLNIRLSVQTDNGVTSRGRLIGFYVVGDSVFANFNTPNEYRFLETPFVGTDGSPSEFIFNQSVTININDVPRDKRIYFFFSQVASSSSLILKTEFVGLNKLTINATENYIDNVIKAVTWYDLLNQTSKVVNGIPLNAELFEVDGDHYKNAIWNRRMISQKTDTLNFKPKDVFNSVQEVACDVEIMRDEIFIGKFEDYYTNDEIGVFQIIPDKDYTRPYNERFMAKKLNFKYKKYEQERTTIGTSNAIHTATENSFPNFMVDGTIDRDFDFIRDGYLKQSTINLEIKQPTTSTENDNDIFIENMVELSPSSFGTFGAILSMQWTLNQTPFTSILKILNRDSNGDTNDVDSNGDTNDVVFTWDTIGIEVGGNFEITQGVNVGTYEIMEITKSVLTLRNTSNITIFEGDGYVKVKYFYTNVAWQTRTNQGVLLPLNNTMNDVFYSLKRNILRLGSYLATCMDFNKTTITNNDFKSNGAFTSQLVGESEPITENANIDYSDLNIPILSTLNPKLKVVAELEQVVDYMEAYKVSRGFVRCLDLNGEPIKGYIKKSDYNPFSREFNIDLELKKEPGTMIVNIVDGVLEINGTNYGTDNWWNIENDFIKFYDEKSRAINKFIRYNLVILNGITYSSANELSNALANL